MLGVCCFSTAHAGAPFGADPAGGPNQKLVAAKELKLGYHNMGKSGLRLWFLKLPSTVTVTCCYYCCAATTAAATTTAAAATTTTTTTTTTIR